MSDHVREHPTDPYTGQSSLVRVSGLEFEVEIRGKAQGEVAEILKTALGDLPGVYFKVEELISAFDEPLVQDALKALSPGKVLKYRLENKGWSLTDLAERSGVSVPNISSMIKGGRAIGAKTAALFAQHLGCSTVGLESPRKRRTPRTATPPQE